MKMLYTFALILNISLFAVSSVNGIIHQDASILKALKNDLLNLETCLKKQNIDANKVAQDLHTCSANAIQSIQSAAIFGSRLLEPVIDTFCSRNSLLTCFTTTKQIIEVCLPKDKNDEFESVFQLLSGVVEYSCQNNGQPIRDFLSKSSLDCLNYQKHNIEKCVEKFEVSTKTEGLEKWFSKENCKKQDLYFDCLLSAMKSCEDKTAFRVFDGLYKNMYKYTPCATATACELFVNSILMLFTCFVLILN